MKERKELKNILVVIMLLIGSVGNISAQSTHYLFFQTENNQPFYLRIMGATLSSNATGYLLIPKLTDGKYEIQVGFAKSTTEQAFSFNMEGRDMGFSLKQELDNTWSLFNLVDFSLLRGTTVNIQIEPEIVKKDTVVKAEVKAEVKKMEKEEVKEPVVPVEKPVVKPQVKVKPVLPEISKIYDRSSVDGVDMVFVVKELTRSDTVILYVPAIKPAGIAGKVADNKAKDQLNETKMLSTLITHPFKTN